jgi:parallel beta-helix repeat protein
MEVMGKKLFVFMYVWGIVLYPILSGCHKSNDLLTGHYFYIDAENGNDENDGMSSVSAFKTLQGIDGINLNAGDKILLKSGQVHYGELKLKGAKGKIDLPIVITSYGNGDKPMIDAKGKPEGILLKNCSFIEVADISISANGKDGDNPGDMRCGVKVIVTTKGNYSHIYLSRLDIKNIFFEDTGFIRSADEITTANGTQSYGYGIRFINKIDNAHISDVKISDCNIENVSHTGIKFSSHRNSAPKQGVRKVEISGNNISYTGGPGIQMSGVANCTVSNNIVDHSGSSNDTRKWGRGSGLWTWGSVDVLIEHNKFTNANGPGDSAGAHIDFNCSDVIIQYNISANNAGGFCEILGNNYNCAYRYNISINDGYRVKGVEGAFQEGKIFWLSGFCGKNSKRKGPFNTYFYNNTIYVKKDIVAKIAVDKVSKGILIANNIFYIKGDSRLVSGDQYKPEESGGTSIRNVVFRNNLYLKKDNWPSDAIIQDEAPFFGDPGFKSPGGMNISDYIPGNIDLVKDKGIKIKKIPGDNKGLKKGLDLKYDILGNEINEVPDIGAIEL